MTGLHLQTRRRRLYVRHLARRAQQERERAALARKVAADNRQALIHAQYVAEMRRPVGTGLLEALCAAPNEAATTALAELEIRPVAPNREAVQILESHRSFQQHLQAIYAIPSAIIDPAPTARDERQTANGPRPRILPFDDQVELLESEPHPWGGPP